jgi:hypothetical protein
MRSTAARLIAFVVAMKPSKPHALNTPALKDSNVTSVERG